MKLAYADPPYPGCAHLYAGHPDYAGEVDHLALIQKLHEEYDGWALSTSSKALQYVLSLCDFAEPHRPRVLVWVKNTVQYAWEPVLVVPARHPEASLRDWIHAEPEAFQWRPKPDSYVIGQKPEPFALWLFAWLGAEPQDTLDDLFPGSGAVGQAWEKFRAQTRLPDVPVNDRAVKRARERALKEHPSLLTERG